MTHVSRQLWSTFGLTPLNGKEEMDCAAVDFSFTTGCLLSGRLLGPSLTAEEK